MHGGPEQQASSVPPESRAGRDRRSSSSSTPDEVDQGARIDFIHR